MRDNLLRFVDTDKGSRRGFPAKPILFHCIKRHLCSLVDCAIQQSRGFHAPGSFSCLESFSCVSQFACGLLFWASNPSVSKLIQNVSENHKLLTLERIGFVDSPLLSISNRSGALFTPWLTESSPPFVFGKLSKFVIRFLLKSKQRSESLPTLAVATESIPPLSKESSSPPSSASYQPQSSPEELSCQVNRMVSKVYPMPELNSRMNVVEPRTGIEFPMLINGELSDKNSAGIASEVLVGTGSRTMKVVRIKTLKVYAFGFYVHPYSVCEKLGPKYGSSSLEELNKRHDFFKDLLMEDIGMSVRLVINCNGIKINTVRDAFERSLRERMLKTNPETNFDSVKAFGSFFTNEISIPAGTTVEFRRTADGSLITEVGGNQIGAVHSKELCTAFFDMYIGDGPVSQQTKEEIGRNVAKIVGKC